VLNGHNTVYARSGPLYATGVSLGPPVVDANGISIASAFLQASLGDRPTDRPTDHATFSVTILAERTVEKPNSVIVDSYKKYLLEQSTQSTPCLPFLRRHLPGGATVN